MNHNAITLYDFDQCKTNERNGSYGGLAGDKEGIIFKGQNWIVKYPKSTKGMTGDLPSYMTSPLSEYIGSHIYSILGYDVHDTEIGIRNNKLVVACRDFCKQEGALREIRTLKNIYNDKLSKLIEERLSPSAHGVDLQELLIQLKYNPILCQIPEMSSRFWNCVVVDIFINNNDRNNGNWGVLYQDGSYRPAPIFDNGAAFSNKHTDEKIASIINDPEKMQTSSVNTRTAYTLNGKILSSKDILQINDPLLHKALKKNIPLISKKMPDIKQLILSIPEEYEGLTICSPQRKQFYLRGMELRLEQLLSPALLLHNSLGNERVPGL